MSIFRWVGVPSSSIDKEPLQSNSVPSSTTVHKGEATFSPTRPEKVELPFRLKSPSRPCPTASCKRTPGHPGPSTTCILPAGAGFALKFTPAIRTASLAKRDGDSELKSLSNEYLPPPPALPLSLLFPSTAITETLNLTNGLISAAKTPSEDITNMCSKLLVKDAETSSTRGSALLAS